MLVQLSPWETVKTSILKRRKKSNSSGGEADYAATFVFDSSRRAHRKKRDASDGSKLSEIAPLVAITTDHRVSLLGRASVGPGYDECPALQFSSRPAASTSFFPPLKKKNGSSSRPLPRIPALLDAKRDRMVSVQQSNSAVCVWNSHSCTGPDDPKSVSHELRSPALSLSLLSAFRGMFYGTCKDGSLFIATISQQDGKDSIAIRYMGATVPPKSTYVGTVAYVEAKPTVETNKRRKLELPSEDSIAFCQVHITETACILIRHRIAHTHIYGAGDGALGATQTTVTMRIGDKYREKCVLDVDDVNLLNADLSLSPTISLSYNATIGNRRNRYLASISTSAGSLTAEPLLLPQHTKHVRLASASVAAVATETQIHFYDIPSAVLLATHDHAFGGDGNDWLLCTDPRLGIIAVLHENQNGMCASFSTVGISERIKSLPYHTLSLAEKLSSTLASDHGRCHKKQRVSLGDLDEGNSDSASSDHELQVFIAAVSNCTEATKGGKLRQSLKDLERVASSLLSLLEPSTGSEQKSVEHNPQDDVPSKTTLMNGSKHEKQEPQPSTIIPSISYSTVNTAVIAIQRAFNMDGVSPSLGDTLSSILDHLLQSKKVSAISHFNGTDAAGTQRLEKLLMNISAASTSPNSSGTTSLHIMVSMLEHCVDVSEEQMVAMLNFIACHGRPQDIAKFILSEPGVHFTEHELALARDCDEGHSMELAENKLDDASGKLVLMGASVIIRQIMMYSRCNESMLRVALVKGISHDSVACFLARLFLDLYSHPNNVAIEGHRTYGNDMSTMSKTTSSWISAICQAFKDEISEPSSGNKKAPSSVAAKLKATLGSLLAQSEAIVGLQDDVLLSTELLRKEKEATTRQRDDECVGYTIETLRF